MEDVVVKKIYQTNSFGTLCATIPTRMSRKLGLTKESLISICLENNALVIKKFEPVGLKKALEGENVAPIADN